MKHLHSSLFLLAALLLIVSAQQSLAQAQQYIHYQAVARDASGALLVNQPVTLRLSIREGSESGMILYRETHRDTTNPFGLIMLNIGAGTPVQGNFTTIPWSSGRKFLVVELDPDAGTDYAFMGASEMLAVPYANYAYEARETDPAYRNSTASGIGPDDISRWNAAYGWGDHTKAGYLTDMSETDPIFERSVAASIDYYTMMNWNLAYSWGNHNVAGYLKAGEEKDPKVNVFNTNSVPVWDGNNLVDGTITDKSGNVGIGTMNPGAKLEVNGQVKIDGGNPGAGKVLVSDATGLASWQKETDPLYSAAPASGITSSNISNWNTAYGWGNHALVGYLTSYTETDPLYSAAPASGITSSNISNWNTAYGWGNHALVGYLTSFTETDPVYNAAPAAGITSNNITNWNTAFGWGNHALAGYLTSYTETDPIYSVAPASGITSANITNWNTAFGWGNHALAGYLTSYTETDPIYSVAPASGITSANITNWNTAFGWGNHALAGYLTSYTETDPIYSAAPAAGIASTDITNWNTAYGWGNHALAGYLTSYTETDPLYSAAPASGIASTDITNWNTAYGWGNHALAGYLTSYTETDPIYNAAPASGIASTDIANWNTAYGWGNHASAGYLTSYTETDPKILSATANSVPVWNGSALVNGTITDVAGNVGIGAIPTPGAKLEVAGQLKITGGVPGAGKVLTSDASGLATWETPSGGGGSLDAAYDFGGSGAGRTIIADAGALAVTGYDGFIAYGAIGHGVIPTTGTGPRMMWYPRKAAFRAGYAMTNEWDDANIGNYSTALGYNSKASGVFSFAVGAGSIASASHAHALGAFSKALGLAAVAVGTSTNATGDFAAAYGYSSTASGPYSVAIGFGSDASAEYSVAIGYKASTGNYSGSMAVSDGNSFTQLTPTTDDQLAMRFAGGYVFYSNEGLTTGVTLAAGAGSWTNLCDRNKKEHFQQVDGEEVLTALRDVPVTTWNYKQTDPSVRYMGPMAQDFWQAFKLSGTDSLGINTVNIDGVNLAAVKALDERTSNVKRMEQELREVKAELALKTAELARVKAEVASLQSMREELAVIKAMLERNGLAPEYKSVKMSAK